MSTPDPFRINFLKLDRSAVAFLGFGGHFLSLLSNSHIWKKLLTESVKVKVSDII